MLWGFLFIVFVLGVLFLGSSFGFFFFFLGVELVGIVVLGLMMVIFVFNVVLSVVLWGVVVLGFFGVFVVCEFFFCKCMVVSNG